MQPKKDTFYNIKGNGEESEAKAERNFISVRCALTIRADGFTSGTGHVCNVAKLLFIILLTLASCFYICKKLF